MSAAPLRIALVFPSLLGTYGDSGNALVLAQRLRWRGLAADLLTVGVDDPLPAADLYVLGGGEDTAQTLAVSRLGAAAGNPLAAAVADGAWAFAVCAGFQIAGENFLDGAGAVHPGLGLIDCTTDRLDGPRAVGELVVDCALDGVGAVTSYENHGGRTRLGPDAEPFGTVRLGIGNGDAALRATTVDGAVQGRVVATYGHGPVLARNPALADWLLTRIAGPLPPLDDPAERGLHDARLRAVTAAGRGSRLPWRRQWRPAARDGAFRSGHESRS